ncbi:endonuclease/exonuclease/phosphatase family protein [Vibrio sp. 188UL20-2]|uniref:Endonuclease/exonuclease/phosphatase family protein n=2 Tax=Vibrio ulleungensis TaxID=2807619 RepID=A0ABS2HHZ8_9VIBR|nr:endonuclease/exonuclease/phosphatase family protein [Vibrio ulleungensis]
MKFTFMIISSFCLLILARPVIAETIRVGSWNLEWLTSHGVDKFPQSQRQAADFNRLSDYATALDAPIIALQEVNDIQAAMQVFGSDYQIVLSSRSQAKHSALQFSGINQYTGFALHHSVQLVANPPDLTLASTPSQKLRFGNYIIVRHNQQNVHLLSVHLKAGCQKARTNSRSCTILAEQADQLNLWVQQRIQQNQAFILAGDFNHQLSYPNDWLMQRIIADTSQTISLDSRQSEATCAVKSNRDPNQTHRYSYLIDHMLSHKLKKHSSTQQQDYALQDVINYQLSDHCPIVTDYLVD